MRKLAEFLIHKMLRQFFSMEPEYIAKGFSLPALPIVRPVFHLGHTGKFQRVILIPAEQYLIAGKTNRDILLLRSNIAEFIFQTAKFQILKQS